MNKPLSIIVAITGVCLAIFFGLYVMWCEGLLSILNNVTVVNNTLTIEKLPLIIGSLKMILAPTVFSFIMNTTALTSYRLWNNEEDADNS